MSDESSWTKVAEVEDLPPGRVMTVSVGRRSLALTNCEGVFGALDNRCPHQGGPLGEGSIEKGWLRCPWHGYDYNPTTGEPPPGFSDKPACFDAEAREDGVYVLLPPEKPRERTSSDVMVETMVNWGVTSVFGMVGHSNLGFADAMRVAEERGDLRFFGVRHEGAAAFAATAYGKLTGELAACFAIAGPGSTNLMTGLYDAKVDRAPVLAISGQVPSKNIGRGAFQDVDLTGAFADVAAYSQTLHAGADYAEMVTLAAKTALVERDVAHLVIPDEVQLVPVGDAPAGGPDGRRGDEGVAPPSAALDAAVKAIAEARRPLVIVGNGARFSMDAVMEFASQIGAPVATTFKAKGQVPDRHPLGCGVLGRSGTPIASWFMNESDLVVVFGASFSNHTGIAEYKRIVQVDHDPMALGRFHPVEVPVLGDVAVTARAIAAGLPDAVGCLDHRPEVAERWAIWRDEKRARLADDRGEGVSSAAVFAALSELAPPDAVMCVDVGNNTYSFGRYFEVDRQSVLMSGYLGSIGFGFPAAMGAWAAVGADRRVIGISGDGGFGQYAMEVTTAVKYGMDITHLILDNGELGKISKEQRAGEWDVWQTSLVNPDFATFAESCGARGWRVDRAEQLEGAISAALDHRGPAIVVIQADPLLV